MLPLGKIVRLQIQPSSLKQGEGELRSYSPESLIALQELTLTRTGALARAPDGRVTIDVHNSAHPQTKNGGHNALSFVFTGHYAAMRARFGGHLSIGCAGESILIEADEVISLDRVSRGVVIETQNGRVGLGKVIVARPCSPFSKFAIGKAGAATAEVKAALQFLDQGMRGFYCELDGESPATIALGDWVFAL
jgi:hypothetical protein